MKNKSLVVNIACILMIVAGYFSPASIKAHVLAMGYFGFSGAITNWLAIHMLFERVPGLYGSGIIPLRFEAFKDAIRSMIMNQFFTSENIARFTQNDSGFKPDLAPIIEHLDYDTIFDGFLGVIESSKFGSMLAMFGGVKALDSMRGPFTDKLKQKLAEIADQPGFLEKITHNATAEVHHVWQDKIAEMVNNRLAELTPQMVKDIIQEMIRSHLGWLVVWGGVFGSLIGLVSSFFL